MNLGNKILIVIITFIIGMLSMVYVASKQTNEMFDKDYYDKELKYQSFIDASQNLKKINGIVEVVQNKDSLNFHLPKLVTTNIETGYIELLKANDGKKDFKQNLETIHATNQTVLKSNLSYGMYTVRIFWINNKVPFYFEKKLNILK